MHRLRTTHPLPERVFMLPCNSFARVLFGPRLEAASWTASFGEGMTQDCPDAAEALYFGGFPGAVISSTASSILDWRNRLIYDSHLQPVWAIVTTATLLHEENYLPMTRCVNRRLGQCFPRVSGPPLCRVLWLSQWMVPSYMTECESRVRRPHGCRLVSLVPPCPGGRNPYLCRQVWNETQGAGVLASWLVMSDRYKVLVDFRFGFLVCERRRSDGSVELRGMVSLKYGCVYCLVEMDSRTDREKRLSETEEIRGAKDSQGKYRADQVTEEDTTGNRKRK
ncbi:hypothetical protein V6N12_020147 [Hibiscus sabdariffa]|uniref:Uncharacterized protein n=1 Tax=Hibiscus sabdariffa TaxID=183260 RepID=A0ABR1ZYF0_9ROSI